MLFKDVHPDVERYLENDCYCPGEIYDITGFGFIVFAPDDETRIINKADDMTAIVLTTARGKKLDHPQAVIIWHDDPDAKDKIIDIQRVDATENNIDILKSIVDGIKPDGRKLDEFNPGSLARSMRKILNLADAIIID